jgi:hypothetical protein
MGLAADSNRHRGGGRSVGGCVVVAMNDWFEKLLIHN